MKNMIPGHFRQEEIPGTRGPGRYVDDDGNEFTEAQKQHGDIIRLLKAIDDKLAELVAAQD